MTMTIKDIERRRLGEVAHDYEQRGYRVVLEPDSPSLPDFLADFRPGLIARNGGDNVIVEVKSFPTLVEPNDLTQLAQAVQPHQDWRLELIVAPTENTSNGHTHSPDGQSRVLEQLSEARQLLDQGYGRAATLLTLSAVEAAVRLVGDGQEAGGSRRSALVTARRLSLRGILDRAEYETLREVLAVRNAIAHDKALETLDTNTLRALLSTAERLVGK